MTDSSERNPNAAYLRQASARAADRAAGLARVQRIGTPPRACGDAMPVAPARGPVIPFTPLRSVITEGGNLAIRKDGWHGRKAARVPDAFDRIEALARSAHNRQPAATRGPFVAPFTPAQVNAGRRYAALVERIAASGCRASGFEVSHRGGAGSGVSEALLDDMRELRRIRQRIGTGQALRVRRGGARTITDQKLVAMVCIGQMMLGQVLKRFGWAGSSIQRGLLMRRLADILDRVGT